MPYRATTLSRKDLSLDTVSYLRAAARQGRALPAVEQLYGVLLGAGHVVAEVVRRRVASPHHATPPTRGGGAPPALCTPRCRHSELVKFDFVEPCLITNGTPGPGVVADGIETRHAALRIRIARVEGDHRSQRVVVWFLFSTNRGGTKQNISSTPT